MKGKHIVIGGIVGVGLTLGLIIIFRKPLPKIGTTSLMNARQIGLDLGTAYPFYDPLSWTENDSAVEELILSIPQSNIPQLETDYRKLFNRELAADLQEKLDGWNNVKDKFIPLVPIKGITPGINKAATRLKRLIK